MPEYAVVGRSLPRVDGPEKVTGQARFTGDLRIPGLLHARLVLSPYANARIVSIDTSEAEKVPGVVGVYRAGDLPFVEPGSGSRKRDFMARDRALYHGHPVAVVVAESGAAAEDAVALVDVEYDPQDAAVDLLAALEADAPHTRGDGPLEENAEAAMHGGGGGGAASDEVLPANVSSNLHFTRGDIDKVLAESDVVVEETYRLPMVHQGYMEPQVVAVSVDPLGDITVYTSTQAIFYTRNEVAAALGLPNSKVKVVAMTIGGGFGGKFMLTEALAAAVAVKVGRSIRLEYTRMDDFLAANPAPPSVWTIKLGAKKDGAITAMQAKVVFDTGAYSGSPLSIGSLLLGASYNYEAIDIRGYEVLTNKTPAGAYRGPGAVQAAFAAESTVDMLAEKLGMDPFELRNKNAADEGTLRPNNVPWPKIGLKQCMSELESRYRALVAKKQSNGTVKQGVGMALGGWPGGLEPATAICRLNPDGTVTAVLGSVDLSGTDTSFKQITAEAFGLTPEQVIITRGDSSNAPYSGGAGGSKTLYTVGLAVQKAAEDARLQVLNIASGLLEADVDDIEIVDGAVRVKGVPDRSTTLQKIASLTMGPGSPKEPVYGRGSSAITNQSPAFAAHAVRVAVDTETGKVKILDYVACQDVGFAINPAEVDGQIVGGIVQGIGQALYERMAYDESGQITTQSFLDYALPSAGHAPNIEAIQVEVASDFGPYGAKGVGEPPLIPCMPAIANAIKDAIGARITEVPITSEAVIAAMKG
ncbi:MAG: xanthine dehydrogenase family protein molybdopterin-binding subunit [Chloroflexi bacterium]|nr:xanthine dehydrogenase family protein molybdopterin-binding subunit [Chloroflexota bacterium]